ncbi:MAG: 3-deoxy-8-phosphooctulonate synthase [Syntrophaceae bacterium]|nr:3-deoxy-8-phosphooctulonate synthase [Syntrophaceae bacterium]
MNEVQVGGIKIGKGNPLVLIAGPCVIENEEITIHTARELKRICEELMIPLIFKSSFDKANRSSLSSFRGLGMDKGLRVLDDIKSKFLLPVLSDIHSIDQVKPAAEVLDVLQIPAFLCRQTDLILASSRTGKPVNMKKGQFLSPWDVKNMIEKFVSTGNSNLMITERGTSFGYNNLVVDFRGFPIIRSFGHPVFFDVTHSLQLPGGEGNRSGGQREYAPHLMRAAVGAGVDGLFIEVHPDPNRALCDGPNMLALNEVKGLLQQAKAIQDMVRTWEIV